MTIPQDSVLKRHYVSLLRMEIENKLGPRPTDSVLKRHHLSRIDTLLQQSLDEAQAGTPVVAPSERITEPFPAPVPESTAASTPNPAPVEAPESAPAQTATPPPASQQSGSGGLFGWLKRLFGG